MPHDRDGKLLQVGDKVVIPGTVLEIHASEEYCNARVEFDESMPPYTHKDSISSINTKQLVKVEPEPDLDLSGFEE